jgi:hypothetical protein
MEESLYFKKLPVIVTQLVKKHAAFYGFQRFINVLTEEPATDCCYELNETRPCPLSLFLQIHFSIVLPLLYTGFPKWSLTFTLPIKNSLYISSRFCTCYMPHPSHPIQFDHRNNIW